MAVKEKSNTAIAERPRDRRVRPFRPPQEFPPELGVQVLNNTHIQGVVSTDNIRTLLDAFGLQQLEQFTIPFHHIKAEHGERWAMRIESAGVHQLEDKHVIGHQWIYRREFPEESEGN